MITKRNFSCKREAILQALRSTKTHPTAEWVCEKARETYPNLSLATVYRNLAQLKEDGLAISVGVVDGHERLDGTVAPHPHFVCRVCHAVIDVDVAAAGGTMCQEVNEQYSVSAEHYDITFWGRCANCKDKK